MLYLGRKRIASGGGTTTVTAHQFTNDVSDVKMDGVASLGVLDTIVRADHVHPSDTSREPAFSKNTAFNKNFETSTTEIKANGTVSVGTSSNIARADHIHPFSDAETFAEAERTKSNNATYGAIVHQKEMESYAKPLVKVGTGGNVINIESLTYTTLTEFVTYFKQNYPSSFHARLGSTANNNFKTAIGGTPTGFGNYCQGTVSPIQVAPTDGYNTIYQVFISDVYQQKVATGYIVTYLSSDTQTAYFTGWTTLK